MNVGWTRGQGCRALAELLAADAVAVGDDLKRTVIAHRLDLLVTKKLTSFDLVPVAVPSGIDPDVVSSVVAAVGSGPHSPLAASVAAGVAEALDVDATLVTVHRPSEAEDSAERLEELLKLAPEAATRTIESTSVRSLLDSLDDGALLVVGAPGGWWLNRQLFGPGHRLLTGSTGGTITVRWAERRVFHEMLDPSIVAIGADIDVAAAKRLLAHDVVPVADNGALIGIARRDAISEASAGTAVREVMEDPVSLLVDEPLAAAADLADHLDGSPIPITDASGGLVGVLPPTMGTDNGELGLSG